MSGGAGDGRPVSRASLPSGAARRAVPGPPPPPPPPPLPPLSLDAPERRCRLRPFHWEPIPAARIDGRPNVWTTTGGRRDAFPLDLRLLDELFEQRPDPHGGRGRGRRWQQISLLDPKKILNLGIFLKQFKRPVQEIVADIQDGDGSLCGAEKLLELTKMLPDIEEVQKLATFRGPQSRLSEAELFALLLVQVPSYASRLELLLLKEEFFPSLQALRSAIQTLTAAALELLDCEELHDLIRLVLKAGNYMNEGGYAGSALGFRVPSLLRLADTKANRPGMDLLHFVALEVKKKDPNLLCFPSKLQHLGPASRIVDQEVMAEFQKLDQRLSGAWGGMETLGLQAQMATFLQGAEAELKVTRASLERLHQTRERLCNFLCEDLESFSVADCCGVFHAFGERFLAAVQENQAWEATEQQERKAKRRSIATCSALDPGLQDVRLDPLFLQRPCPAVDNPQAAGKPAQLPVGRRHTLSKLPPDTEAPALKPACGPPSCDLQEVPVATQASSKEPLLPGTFRGFCFSHLFHKPLPEEVESPVTPPASPQKVSPLVRFFRRLGGRDKPRGTSHS